MKQDPVVRIAVSPAAVALTHEPVPPATPKSPCPEAFESLKPIFEVPVVRRMIIPYVLSDEMSRLVPSGSTLPIPTPCCVIDMTCAFPTPGAEDKDTSVDTEEPEQMKNRIAFPVEAVPPECTVCMK
jgi:hypothetical protein